MCVSELLSFGTDGGSSEVSANQQLALMQLQEQQKAAQQASATARAAQAAKPAAEKPATVRMGDGATSKLRGVQSTYLASRLQNGSGGSNLGA